MTLVLEKHSIGDLVFGEKTEVAQSSLIINEEDVIKHLLAGDSRLADIKLSIARPGDSCRIICVKDVIEPRCKVSGQAAGNGRLRILQNIAVVTCGKIVGFQEGIIDMSGPGAAHTPFSKTCNLVLEIEVVAGLEPHAHEEAVRMAGLKTARLLAEAVSYQTAAKEEVIALAEPAAEAPKVACLYMLLSQGLLHDTYVLGENAGRCGLPKQVEPELLFDEAITSGNCVSACDKNTTYHHQNNPVLRELYERHNRGELNFVGVVLVNEPVRLAAKNEAAEKASALLAALRPDGVVISKEGFGNPDSDQMLLIRRLEKAGIKTAALTDEYAGSEGTSQSLADTTKEADALVSVGNANARIVLPAMKELLGPLDDLTKLAGAYPQSLRPDGSLEIELQGLIGATNQLGFQKLRAVEV